ncbi:hypothetical protein MSAN_01985300 [Mycena sanguinolenta]|uniref:Uncharacterized protein n=1 Tax=Mycena sanguinolenta TaxID=230812 RepID=A0A8H7CMW7_9AGAR|nr:hypothetical protein MSAN_01985300 [Mycena sanguinolenta]
MVISRLGDDLDEFAKIINEASSQLGFQRKYQYLGQNGAILEPEEFNTMQTSLAAMKLDIQLAYQDAVDSSHYGRPTLVQTIPSDGPGRPRIWIDPEFLEWAHGQRPTSSLHRYLGVSRSTVRRALLEHGIAQPQSNPFSNPSGSDSEDSADAGTDDILEPDLPDPTAAEIEELAAPSQRTISFTGPLSDISDDDLDILLIRLRTHYRRAGLSMLNGMLRRLGHRVPVERVCQALFRIDPVRRIFERIHIRRRKYQVLGPNSLWHHDGQHGNLPE